METRVFGVWLKSPGIRLQASRPLGKQTCLWPREGALGEELARITAKARTAAEGTLVSGKCLLFRGL